MLYSVSFTVESKVKTENFHKSICKPLLGRDDMSTSMDLDLSLKGKEKTKQKLEINLRHMFQN